MPLDGVYARSFNEADTSGCLPRGYRLQDFVIERVIAEGGFGVVYAALDTRLQRRVAIKEYMPGLLARRGGDFSVQPRSSVQHQDAFAIGLKSFINEAQLLARFDHPSLVRVLQFWEDKGTGFIVMPLYDGPTLKQFLQRQPAPGEAWLRNFLDDALDALEVLHAQSCLHRDIAPDNMLVLDERRPLLLDFGAARRVLDELTQTLTVIVKPGYAPLEQYAEGGSLKQGPWTDLYALAATAHAVIAHRPPPPAVARVVADDLQPLAVAGAGRYSPALLRALDAALAVRPEQRPQSVAALRALLAQRDVDDDAKTMLLLPAANDAAAAVDATTPTAALLPVADAAEQPAVASPCGPVIAPATLQPRAADAAPALAAAPAPHAPQLPSRPAMLFAARPVSPPAAGGAARSPARPATLVAPLSATLLPAAQPTRPLTVHAPLAAQPAPLPAAYARKRWIELLFMQPLGARQIGVTLAVALAGSVLLSLKLPAVLDAPPPPLPAPTLVDVRPITVLRPAQAAAEATAALPEPAINAIPQHEPVLPETPTVPMDRPAASASPAASKPGANERRAAAEQRPAPTPALSAAPAAREASKSVTTRDSASAARAGSEPAPVPSPTPIATSAAPTAGSATDALHVMPAAYAAPAPTPAPSAPAPLQPIDRPSPAFAREALLAGVDAGRVVARLAVEADGRVGGVRIVSATPRRVFDREVERAVMRWRYQPPGERREVDVEFVFRAE